MKVLACFLVLAFSLQVSADDCVQVLANQPWAEVDRPMVAGDILVLQHKGGTWTANPAKAPYTGPGGDPKRTKAPSSYRLPNAPEGCLVARVGDGPVFAVLSGRAEIRITADMVGKPIRLGINDGVAKGGEGFADNRGDLVMNVAIQKQ